MVTKEEFCQIYFYITNLILKKRKSLIMLSKVIGFFDSYNHKKEFNNIGKKKNNDKKSMEWQDDEKDHESLRSMSWNERNLEKSKSDSSITAIGDCNYRTQGVQVSLENCDAQRTLTTALETLDTNEDDDDIDENETNFKSILTKGDYNTCNHIEYAPPRYGFKTQDVTTRQLIVQGPEILNFQGIRHSPDEISPNWKKDCRMWLWKSVRFSNQQSKLQMTKSTVSTN